MDISGILQSLAGSFGDLTLRDSKKPGRKNSHKSILNSLTMSSIINRSQNISNNSRQCPDPDTYTITKKQRKNRKVRDEESGRYFDAEKPKTLQQKDGRCEAESYTRDTDRESSGGGFWDDQSNQNNQPQIYYEVRMCDDCLSKQRGVCDADKTDQSLPVKSLNVGKKHKKFLRKKSAKKTGKANRTNNYDNCKHKLSFKISDTENDISRAISRCEQTLTEKYLGEDCQDPASFQKKEDPMRAVCPCTQTKEKIQPKEQNQLNRELTPKQIYDIENELHRTTSSSVDPVPCCSKEPKFDCDCNTFLAKRDFDPLAWKNYQEKCCGLPQKYPKQQNSYQDLGWDKDTYLMTKKYSSPGDIRLKCFRNESNPSSQKNPNCPCCPPNGPPNPYCLNVCGLKPPRCMTLRQMKDMREFWRLTFDNMWLNETNQNLKLRLQHVRTTTFAESTRILDSIMAYCDAKAKATKNRKHVIGEGRNVKHGCPEFSNVCGGYTPSGWNKLKSLGLLPEDDMLPEGRRCFEGSSIQGRGAEDDGRSEKSHSMKDHSIAMSEGPGIPGSTRIRPEKRVCGGMGGGGFRPSARLLGEMCFQLERRILDYVFGLEGAKKRRFYGYTVSNICYMMEKESANPDGGSDVVSRTEMTCRLRKLLCALDKYGYDIKIHADFSQEVINKYGLLPSPPDAQTVTTFGLNDPATVACLISRLSKRQSEVHNLNILLNCLHFLSTCDGRPLFVW